MKRFVITALFIPSLAIGDIDKNNLIEVVNATSQYTKGIACNISDISTEDVAALIPFDGLNRFIARYAVIWSGDIGCNGGSQSTSNNIAIVSVGAANSFFVIPDQSSPLITFDLSHISSRVKLLGNGNEHLILESLTYHPSGNDPRCCPSYKKKSVVRLDKNDNWRHE